jgi:uncharacterized protein YukE
MSKSNNTASFMLRFTQKIFEDDQGESDIQWRGKISHVQGGDEKNFTKMEDAISFIQTKLTKLTLNTTSDKSKEEQEGILSKSFDIWKKMAINTPKMVMDAIKDPKSQVAQIKDQLTDVTEDISQKLEIDTWRTASKADFKSVVDQLQALSKQVDSLNDKIDKLAKK